MLADKSKGHVTHDPLLERAKLKVESVYSSLWATGSKKPFDAVDLHAAAGGLWFTGTVAGQTIAHPNVRRVFRLDEQGGLELCPDDVLRVCAAATAGQMATLIARQDGQQALSIEWGTPSVRTPNWIAAGRVEHLAWSPCQDILLMLVAGACADHAGIAGGHAPTLARLDANWEPRVEGHAWQPEAGRELWLWKRGETSPLRLTSFHGQPWEVAWCGSQALLAVASDAPGEDHWYEATLRHHTLDGQTSVLRRPPEQIGCPCASEDGQRLAWIEAACSDRGLVCGTAWLAIAGGRPHPVDFDGLEVTHLHWRDARRLVAAGVNSLRTRVVELNVETGLATTLWQGQQLTLGGWLPHAIPLGDGSIGAVVEGLNDAPSIVEIRDAQTHVRARLAGQGPTTPIRVSEQSWTAHDGLDIHGLLIEPADPHQRPQRGWPLLVDVHGGPIHAHRPRWIANLRAAPALVALGWAVLLPNPRGSSGRGQDFARRVIGDMGGADAQDLLAGVDSLVAAGLVDANRIAITGSSYGGFMSCWLPTQCARFAAGVAMSPVTDWVSQHHGSHIPWFDQRFLAGRPDDASGPYHARSPLHFAASCETPMLLMAGLLDRSTPPEQARYFHAALQFAGRLSELVSYPLEGHSLRGTRGYLDSAARTMAWLARHAGPG